jgi:hypothetical protein
MRGSRLRAACLGLGLAALTGCWVFWGGMDRAPERADRELRPDQPIAAAMFRYRQRLSEDGTIPENALLRAKAQRDRMPVFEWLEGEPEGGEAGIQGVSPGSWTWLGPGNIGGRIRGVLIHPSNPSIIYVGACSGGIWKTVNGGSAWFPLDDFMPTLAVNCLAMDPANPEILYAGTGEGFFETVEGTSNTAAVRGAGIFKSVDAGETWFQLPSTTGTDWYFVNRIAICPTNPSLMLVATTKGIFRSTNGGASFTKTNTRFAYDVRFHPTNPNLAIAGFHDDGAMRTLDGGATWVASTGLTGHRTELAYYDGNPSIIYAGVSQSGQIKLYRSLDGGATFALRTSGSGISTYEAYNSTLWVDPTNSDRIIFGGVYLYRSIDGGVTHTRVFNSVHADMHNIVHHPAYNGSTNRTVYFATDGGLYRTTDSLGTSATGLNNNLGITQFYGAVMNPISGRVMGGTQDNGTKLFTGSTNWATTFGGDGGFCATDPTDANYFYGEVQWARIFRSTNGGTSASYIHGGPNPITGVGTSQFNFIPYFMLDPNEPNRMYVCGRYLWRSNNVKATQPDWSRIKSTIEPGGTGGVGPPPGDGGGAHFAQNPPWNISAMAVAQGNPDLIFLGYNNGEIWKSVNGTAAQPTWTRVDDGAGPVPARWVSKIVIHPTDHSRVYVSFMGWHSNNVWRSANGGSTWTEITGASPAKLPSAPISAFAVHPTQPGWLFAGGDLGLFFSADDGQTWTVSNQGPGIVPIEELHWMGPTSLLAVTHGRGIYQAALNPPVMPFVPDSFAVIEGTHLSGRLSELFASDDRRVHVRVSPSSTSGQIEMWATSPIANPSKLRVKIEASTSGTVAETMGVAMYGPNGPERAIAFKITPADTVFQVEFVGAQAARYVNPTTRKVRMLVGWKNRSGQVTTLGLDQVLFEVEP